MTELSENCASYPAGTLIWIADADVVWKKAEVVETAASGQITVLVVETGQTTSIKKTDLTHLCNPDIFSSDGIVGLEDLTELVHLHEASILDSLNIRFDVDHIYTFTGPIVIAVNPFKSIPALYDTKCMETFLSPSPNRVPHVFFSAATAYRGLCKTKISQTVLISGESGAGKTESTKFVMRLLAIAGSENADKPSQIERQILQSNPLLEALGNAKTNRNDNSSRFGKFIEMQFSLVPCPGQEDPAGRLAGAMIHTYLLETVRVCHQLEGERNYHSFYQICAAAAASSATGGIYRFPQMESSSSSAAQICNVEFDFSLLGPYSDFRYLTGSSCHSLKGVNDLQEFESTVCAMQTIGIPHGDQVSLFNLIGGVLHLGNIKFENPQGNSEASVVCSESRKSSLALASSLLKLSPELLEECLTLRSISTRDGEIKIPLKLKESIDSRDTLAKSLYGTAFLKMVELTNGSIGYVKSIDLFCGVLDIFGFECFTYNSFEQLCINFTNERLQQFFNQFIFQCEEMLYKAENITWNKLDFPDNQDCVDLIDRKGNGIFAMLDEECFVPKGSDKAFCNKLIKAHTGNIRFASIKVKQENFVVNHFAGPVSYCSHGFLEKNRDQLSVLMRNCVVTSEDNFVKDCFETFLSRDKRKQQQQHTVSSQFRQQLSHLMETVSQTQPHFIRCVKPNSRNVCEVFERSTVTEQLRYGGVLQAVQVSRAGYPIRISYQEALVDYLPLCTREVKRAINTILDPREKITEMMRHLSDLLSLNTWAVGKTLLFFKRESYEALSSARSRLRIESVIFIQSCWRGVGQRRQFLYTRNAMVKIQCHVRMVLAKRLLKSLRVHHAATRIQSTFRRYVARKYFTSLVASAIHVQNVIRGHEARRRFWQLKTLSVVQKIQNAWRGWKCRSYYNHFRAGVIKTQMHWRGRKAKRVLRQLRAEMRDSVQLGEQNRILKEEIRVLAEKLSELARSKTETSRLGASSTQSIMLRNVESNFAASTTISSNHHHPRILAESSHNGPNQVSYRLCRSGKVPIFSIFSSSRSVTPNCLVNIPAADEKHNELELLLNRLSLIIMEKPSSDDSLPAVADVVSVLYHKLHGNLEGFESPTRKKNPVDQIFSSPQTDSTGLDERRSSSSPGSYSATSPAVPLHVFSKIPLCCIFETKPKVVLDDILTSPVNSSSHDSDVLRRLRACSKETSNILDTTDRKIESFYQSDLELLKERKAADVLSTTTSIDVLVFTGESNDEMSMFVSSDNNKTYAITVQGRKLNVVHVPFGGCIEEQHTKLIKKSRRVVIVYDDLRTDSYRSTSMIIKMTTHVHDRICLLQNIKEGGEGPQLKNSLALKDLCSRSNIATFVNRSIADTLTDFLPIRGDFRTSPTSSSSNESSSRQAPRSIGNLVSRIQSFLGKTEKSIILNGRGSTNHGGLEKTLRIGCATTTPSAITCIAFGSEKSNPLYSLMAVSTMDGQILLYRVYRSISETKKYFEDHKQITPPANFSYESCAPDGEEKIVPSVTLCGHSHEITKLMFSEDSSELISTSLDRSVRFWCSQTGGMLKVLTDSNQCLAFACVPKVPNIIIVSNSIPGLRVVDSNNGEVLQRLRPESEIRALCFDDEGTVCFAGSKHGVIHILCPSQPGFRTMSFASKHKVSEEMITSVCCFAGDSSSTPKLIVNTCDSALVILSCISGLDSQRTLRIRGLTILKRIKIPPILFPMKSCVVVAETAASVLSPWQDKMFVAVNLANGSFKPRPFTGHESQVVVVSSNQQGNILASGDATGEICIWRTKSA